jgi:hypothetical protein
MTVKIREGGDQWSVEVRGASIGVAQSQAEARKLAEYGRPSCKPSVTGGIKASSRASPPCSLICSKFDPL